MRVVDVWMPLTTSQPPTFFCKPFTSFDIKSAAHPHWKEDGVVTTRNFKEDDKIYKLQKSTSNNVETVEFVVQLVKADANIYTT